MTLPPSLLLTSSLSLLLHPLLTPCRAAASCRGRLILGFVVHRMLLTTTAPYVANLRHILVQLVRQHIPRPPPSSPYHAVPFPPGTTRAEEVGGLGKVDCGAAEAAAGPAFC